LCQVQGVLSAEAGLPGAALTWLARARDAPRANTVLEPLASAVWAGGDAPAELDTALQALQPALARLPQGGANAALLQVHRLLGRQRPDGADLHATVKSLALLPPDQRQLCMPLVCAVVAVATPAALALDDCLQLLAWLEAAASAAKGGEAEHTLVVARAALVRLLAACHMAEASKEAARGW
jgi:hypothetical protein